MFDHYKKIENIPVDRIRNRQAYFHLMFDKPVILEKVNNYKRVMAKGRLSDSPLCRHCGLIVDRVEAGVIVGYWHDTWFLAHKVCEKGGKSEEAFQCQVLDADCNDCKHFIRGPFNGIVNKDDFKLYTQNEKSDTAEQVRYMQAQFFVGSYDGQCSRYNHPVSAWPGQYTGRPCFEHRRSK